MYLNYGRHEVNDDDVDAVVAVLRSSALTQATVFHDLKLLFAISLAQSMVWQ